jgi:catechol 2,3-dioxygenase-like lactoylglutathione lyase family enzyme
MPIAGLDHLVIAVSDWERSTCFYRDVVGVELVSLSRGRSAYRLPNVHLNVHGPGARPAPLAAKPVEPGNSDLCFVWDGTIEEAAQHLRANGIEIVEGPVSRQGFGGDGTSVYFRDPDGSLLEFITYKSGSDSSTQPRERTREPDDAPAVDFAT